MNRQKKIFVGQTAAILSVIPVLIYAYAAGPDPGKSGVPGESTCSEVSCHVGTALNGGGGSVQISAAGGTTYIPGATQRISVTVSDPSQRRWGFQLTARLASDTKTKAGTLKEIDGATFTLCTTVTFLEIPCTASSPIQYIEHTLQGSITTAVGAGNTFRFDWTPPATAAGDIILYAAGNAANGDTNNTGDHIYTTTLRLSPAAGGPKPVINEITHDGDFKPNISANGWVVIKGTELAGNTRIWEGRDFAGNLLPTSLDGTSVKINGKDAFVYYISPVQINVLAPIDSAAGTVSVAVTRGGVTSDSATTTMQKLTPAFFIFQGSKYIASRHEDYSLLGPTTLYPRLSTPAKPGDLVLLFGSAFGPTTPNPVNGQILSGAPPLASTFSITIGGVDVTRSPGTFAGLSATGLYQFNVRVPDSMPNGDAEVIATVDGVPSQSGAFISVQR